MTKQERENIINKAQEMSSDIKDMLYKIVWESQEGQDEHFDELQKSEKVALVGLLNNACNLVQSLTSYQSWFINH